jgi:hypothetical protein
LGSKQCIADFRNYDNELTRPIIAARTLTPTLDHKGVRGIGLLNPRYLFLAVTRGLFQ